ncbi:MAG: NAD(P)-dependent oxidoreductase [Prevotella sp.]|nr:NAD(P)-dependent oxidoreductase [Prevotella sp.]
MTILITGASGFIGSFIVAEALRRGFETWAAVRATSSRKYLKDKRIRFIELDLSNEEKLAEQLSGHTFDYVVHAAGATKCRRKEDFYRVNFEGTKNLVSALLRTKMKVKKFVFLSSLSVFGAVREDEPFVPISPSDTPRPNTHYGKSKLLAEQFLMSVGGSLNYTILRPTGVYGPREKDYFMMVKSVAQRMDFAVGFSRQLLTFVYVDDVVAAVFLALDCLKSGGAYFLSDGQSYESKDFSRLVKQTLGMRGPVIRIVLPVCIMRIICLLCGFFGRITGRMTALNKDKFNILSQRNWLCDISPAEHDLGYHPQVQLAEGVRRAVEWYKREGWI